MTAPLTALGPTASLGRSPSSVTSQRESFVCGADGRRKQRRIIIPHLQTCHNYPETKVKENSWIKLELIAIIAAGAAFESAFEDVTLLRLICRRSVGKLNQNSFPRAQNGIIRHLRIHRIDIWTFCSDAGVGKSHEMRSADSWRARRWIWFTWSWPTRQNTDKIPCSIKFGPRTIGTDRLWNIRNKIFRELLRFVKNTLRNVKDFWFLKQWNIANPSKWYQ